ncbi:MAG: hypothetical protein ABIF10_04840, partial [Candidatus Woesearchaeota archaeon]
PVPASPEPVPVPQPSFWLWQAEEYQWEGQTWWREGSKREIGLNIFHNPVVESSNYLLRMEDEVCLGETIQVNNAELTAEWYSKGGPQDSPPVLFVDDLAAAKAKIVGGDISFIPETYLASCCSGKKKENGWLNNCVFNGQVVCESSCSDYDQNGNEIPSGDLQVLSDGTYTYDCTVSCFMFVHKVSTTEEEVILKDLSSQANDYVSTEVNTILDLVFPEEQEQKYLTFTSEIAFKGVVETKGPSITVEENSYNPEIGVLCFKVKNEGDTDAIIDAITVPTDPNTQILYVPEKLKAGESDDVLVGVTGSDSENIDIAYRAETLGCQKTKEYANSYTFNLASSYSPYEKRLDGAGYQIILKKGIQPEENLLDLRQIIG